MLQKLASITDFVQGEAHRKSDQTFKLSSVNPILTKDGIQLEDRENKIYDFTEHGMSSYLSKVEIPKQFFNKCSADLKLKVLNEFHTKNKNAEVMVRLYDNKIRYMASNRYGIFDDLDVLTSLGRIDEQLTIRKFDQSTDYFRLVATTAEPIQVEGLRPFYPGIQILNSEVGKSSVKIAYLLYEEVCTNGMIVARKTFPMFKLIHRGTDKGLKLEEEANTRIKNMDIFALASRERMLANNVKADEKFIDKLQEDTRLPTAIRDRMNDLVLNYSNTVETARRIDYLSAITEGSQKYDWSSREDIDRIAGEFFWDAV
jgi:hypothetical protein